VASGTVSRAAPGCQEVPGFAGEGQPGLLVVGRSPDPSTTDDITVLRVDVVDRPAGRAFIRWQQQQRSDDHDGSAQRASTRPATNRAAMT
jgi:hypothetical protein